MSRVSLKSPWRYKADGKTVRPFGGVNVVFCGDFWQLAPTGQLALMSDVTSSKVLESAKGLYIMNMFWNGEHEDSLQTWTGPERVLELTTNIRSGGDHWYSDFLDACRKGELQENDYNFLHGYPTNAQITFWHHRTHQHDWVHPDWCAMRGNNVPFTLHAGMKDAPTDEADRALECWDCFQERLRRARCLHCELCSEDAAVKVNTDLFSDSIYITPFNKAVFYYATKRAQKFAHAKQHQLFWIQATDTPPSWFASGFSKSELQNLKMKWLKYHARKTEGVLSLLPCCLDMPYRVTHSHGREFKEYGVHNGTECVLKSWQLHEADMESLKDNTEGEVVLQYLPTTLYVQMTTPLKKPYPGLPHQWFPMRGVVSYWTLDAEENIDISRRGFPLVPNFSTTIHSATGRTMNSSIVDLGDIGSYPSFDAAMRGYIALSRVRAAHHILLAQPFSPMLFRQGTQPFPSLLLEALRGNVASEEVAAQCAAARAKRRGVQLLKSENTRWLCSACQREKPTHEYVAVVGDVWYDEVFATILQPGYKRVCRSCSAVPKHLQGSINMSLQPFAPLHCCCLAESPIGYMVAVAALTQ